MKHVTRRVLPLVLCLVLFVSLLSVTSFADSNVRIDNNNGVWRAIDENGMIIKDRWISRDIIDDNDGQVHTIWFYASADGELFTGWHEIDGNWYWFNTFGTPHMVRNQVRAVDVERIDTYEVWLNTPFYFFNENGTLATGSEGWGSCGGRNKDGVATTFWFWVYPDGTAHKGWKEINGTWYYFDPAMKHSCTVTIDGAEYTFDENGAWVENSTAQTAGWVNYGGTWSYQYADGSWAYGMQFIDGVCYNFGNQGILSSGWFSYFDSDVNDTVWVYADANGVVSQGWINDNGTWYYQNFRTWEEENGTHYLFYLLSDGTYTIDGTDYSFDASGAWVESVADHWVDGGGVWWYQFADGSWAYGWQEIDGSWYYFDNNGAMTTGWLQVGDIWYYFGGNGVMATGWQQIDGSSYFFDNNGVWQPVATESLYEATKQDALDSGMTLAADSGKLLVAYKGSHIEVVLAETEIKSTYIFNLEGEKDLLEYGWTVSFHDGTNECSIGTTKWRFAPGQNETTTIEQMQHNLWVGQYNVANAEMKHTDTEIKWSLDVPEEYTINLSAVDSFNVHIVSEAELVDSYTVS